MRRQGHQVGPGTQVEVYRNLRRGKGSIFSIKSRLTGRVEAYGEVVIVKNPRFVVQQGGRLRVIRDGQKNVHAFVRGALISKTLNPSNVAELVCQGTPIWYNPYKCEQFEDNNGLLANDYRFAHAVLVGGKCFGFADGAIASFK